MLKIEKNVLVVQDVGLCLAIIVAHECFYSYGYTCRITSMRDGTHSSKSYHYLDSAVDCGLRDVDPRHHIKITKAIELNLPDYYDVVCEGDHIHIELDLKKFREAENALLG